MNKHIAQFLNDEENYNVLSGEIANKSKVFDIQLEKKLLREILLSGNLNEDSYLKLIKSNRWEYSDLDVSTLPEDRIAILLDNNKLKFSTSNFEYLVTPGVDKYDKYIDLIESDFDEFFNVRDELDLPEGTTTKLMYSSVLQSENKQKIINDIDEEYKYNLFDGEVGLVRAIIDVCLQEHITLEFQTIEKLFEYEKDKNKKIELLTQYATKLDEGQLYTLLGSLGDPYSSIKPKGFFAYLHKSDLNFKLASALERSGYILNQNTKIKKIQLTLKRS